MNKKLGTRSAKAWPVLAASAVVAGIFAASGIVLAVDPPAPEAKAPAREAAKAPVKKEAGTPAAPVKAAAAPVKVAAAPAKADAAHAPAGDSPRTLHGYVSQEEFFLDYLKKNHPIFKTYEKNGRLVGKPSISDREEEFVEFGGGAAYAKAKKQDHASITYRLGEESILDLPNKFVGPKKCGECHVAQYEAWERSRHAKVVRFPDEITEVKDVNAPVYPATSPAAILPPGITPDAVYAIIGTPRTKYGFLDSWLVRGTFHVKDGSYKDGTGTLVAGGNQFSRSWAAGLTPEVAKKIADWIPGFPTKMEDFGNQRSTQWGMNSYGSQYAKGMLFQPASAYCEVCHSFKFDFKSQDELIAALGNPAELRKHTISKGISCEECHGAGAHLVGGAARGGQPSNCERCHQRFAWNAEQAAASPKKPFTSYFKSRLPSCGTEGSQTFNTKHKDAGMNCSTCHDPHEVTANDWRESYTVPGIKKPCESCHEAQAKFTAMTDTHAGNGCASCHMPVMMSCENFAAIQFSDHAGFDTARTSHIWKINVDPDFKTINPPAGKSRDWKEGPWQLAKDKLGRPALDVMWTCGRTSWSDGHLAQNSGCHSNAISDLPQKLRFADQKQVYAKISLWQKPVKQGLAEAKTAIDAARKALAKSTAAVAGKAQAQLMINQAQDIVTAIVKDGSSGVHAPDYTKQKVDEANLLAAGAKYIAGGGAPDKVAFTR